MRISVYKDSKFPSVFVTDIAWCQLILELSSTRREKDTYKNLPTKRQTNKLRNITKIKITLQFIQIFIFSSKENVKHQQIRWKRVDFKIPLFGSLSHRFTVHWLCYNFLSYDCVIESGLRYCVFWWSTSLGKHITIHQKNQRGGEIATRSISRA